MWTQALQRVSLLGLVGLAACQSSPADPPGSKPQDPSGTDPKVDGQPVAVALAAEQQAEVEPLSALLAQTKDLTGEALREKGLIAR